MRIAFVAAIAAAVQAVRIQTFEDELPSPINLSALEVETEAALQADVDAKLEAVVESVCTSYLAANVDKPMDVATLKAKVMETLKNAKNDSGLSMNGIMKAVEATAKTVTAVGKAADAPSFTTIAAAAKQLWDDYQGAKGFFKNWQANRNKRLGR